MSRRKKDSGLITLFILLILGMLVFATFSILYYIHSIKQGIEEIPFINNLAGTSTYLVGTAQIPIKIFNITTIDTTATYNCTLNGYCVYKFTAPVPDPLPIIIKNNVAQDLVDYSVKIEINNTFPIWDNLKQDGSDIYFTDSQGHPLYFWIEYFNYTEQKAIIWVKASIPADSSTIIYMHYGESQNPYISYDDPNRVFLFYDNFDDVAAGTTDPKWDSGYQPLVVNDNGNNVGEIEAGSYSAFKTLPVNVTGIEVSFRYKIVSKGSYGPRAAIAVHSASNTNNFYAVRNEIGSAFHNYYWIRKYYGGTETVLASDGTTYSIGVWYDNYIRIYNGKIEARLGASTIMSATDSSITLFNKITFTTWDTGNIYYIDDVIIREYVDPEPTVNIITDGNVTIGNKKITIHLNGTTYTITYTPSVQVDATFENNIAQISVENAKLIYDGKEFDDTVTITPKEAWNDNVVYIISKDPTYMYYISYKIPVVKYDVVPYKEKCSLTSCSVNFTYTYEAKDTDVVTPLTVYNVSNVKLTPGTNVIKPDIKYDTPSHLIYINVYEKTINIGIDYDVNIIDRQPITEYRSLTGSIIVKSLSDVVLDNLWLKVTITSTDGTVFTNDYSIQPVQPGRTASIILDYLGIPLPKPGTYKLSLSIWYDPDGKTYYLMKKDIDLVVGYKLTVILNKEAKVEIIGNNEKLSFYGDKIEAVVLPGNYKVVVEAGGTRIERDVVVLDNDCTVVVNIPEQSINTSTYKYVLLGLFMIIVSGMIFIIGKRR